MDLVQAVIIMISFMALVLTLAAAYIAAAYYFIRFLTETVSESFKSSHAQDT